MHVDQVIMEALSLKKGQGVGERHREALQDLEDYFGLKGLLAGSPTLTYKRHNSSFQQIIQAAAACKEREPSHLNPNTCTWFYANVWSESRYVSMQYCMQYRMQYHYAAPHAYLGCSFSMLTLRVCT